MSAAEELLAFSRTRDPWQQDVIRRLFTRTDFTGRDQSDAMAMLKAQFGLREGDVPTPYPLCESDVPCAADHGKPVVLNSIGNVVNADRLAGGQTLPFCVDGLTVIYGDNGSGKSGYCRILKKLCRVREGAEEDVRGNAFDPSSLAAPTEATVRFTVGDSPVTELRWRKGSAPPAELSRVSVFDAKTAALYADQQNRIEFLPNSLDVLPRLGGVCEALGAAVERQQQELMQRTRVRIVDVEPGTLASKLLARLERGTLAQDLPTENEIQVECEWAAADAASLQEVELELISDPDMRARKCRALMRTIEALEEEARAAADSVGDAAVARIRSLQAAARVSRDAASLAAERAGTTALLPGFGSEPWRLLFDSARRYSSVAYPGGAFPRKEKDTRCLLCQQILEPDASERMQAFDAFIRGDAQARASAAEKSYEAARVEIGAPKFRPDSELRSLLTALADEEPESADFVDAVCAYFAAAEKKRRRVVEACATGEWVDLPSIPEAPDFAGTRARLEEREATHRAARTADVREGLRARAAELRGRRSLSGVKETLRARRTDLDLLSRLGACKNACETATISRKNSELRKRYLTKEFEERLLNDIKGLELAGLPFRIMERSEKGASYLGVGMEAAAKVRNKDVLSDGEFRALAVACFLTEVNSIPGHGGIIIDDPVSSLDHLRTRQVARRLVLEAKRGRQVIVFTHDLVFYHELESAAAEVGLPMVGHWIRRTDEFGFGTVSQGEEPWTAKKVKTRLEDLGQRLASIRKTSATTGDVYRESVKSFYTDLRETWERLVEELLLGGVIERFRLGVQTQSLKQVVVTDDDYRRVYFGMKRASEYSGHDRALGAQVALPSADAMAADLADLRAYRDELKARNAKLESDRKRLERPPTGKTS